MKEMATSEIQFKTITEYIAGFPQNVRELLEELRRVIRESAPDAEEAISWGMPASGFMATWCISQDIKIILDFIQGHRQLMLSIKRFLCLSIQRAQSNSG